jgi:(S)-3,5-dihydroxyphenylglycine transaminase
MRGLESRSQWCPGISWNTPNGGFFIVVSVPFTVDDELLERSGREFDVLWTPMSYLHDGKEGENQLRLSCSSLSGEPLEKRLSKRATPFADLGHVMVTEADRGADSMPDCSGVRADITFGS